METAESPKSNPGKVRYQRALRDGAYDSVDAFVNAVLGVSAISPEAGRDLLGPAGTAQLAASTRSASTARNTAASTCRRRSTRSRSTRSAGADRRADRARARPGRRRPVRPDARGAQAVGRRPVAVAADDDLQLRAAEDGRGRPDARHGDRRHGGHVGAQGRADGPVRTDQGRRVRVGRVDQAARREGRAEDHRRRHHPGRRGQLHAQRSRPTGSTTCSGSTRRRTPSCATGCASSAPRAS
jgi:hypothetical protein